MKMNKLLKKILVMLLFLSAFVSISTISVKADTSNIIYMNRDYSGTEAGTYNQPYSTFNDAYTHATSGDIIMFQSDLTRGSIITITKDITFMSADVDVNGDEITEKFSIIRNSSFRTDALITVNANKTLTLENIIIDGNSTKSIDNDGPSILVDGTNQNNLAHLVINDGTELIHGNRELGGGAILSSFGTVTMNGGAIHDNYSSETGAAALGYLNYSEFYLYGGSIYDNESKGYAVNASVGVEVLEVGNDFKIYDNIDVADPSVDKNMIVSGEMDIKDSFTGELNVSLGSTMAEDEPFAILENASLTDVDDIHLDGEPFKHAQVKVETVSGEEVSYVYFDYLYDEYVVETYPTTTLEGELRAYAYYDTDEGRIHSNTIYESKAIPVLNDDDYEIVFNDQTGLITYTWDDTTYGNIAVDLTVTSFDDEAYNIIVDSEPTADTAGLIKLTNPAYPDYTFEIVAPALTDTDSYDIDITEPTDDNPGEITYRLKGTNYVVTKVLPAKTDNAINWTLTKNPDVNATGTVSGTIDGIPGYVYEDELPILSETDYEPIYNAGDDTVIYELISPIHDIETVTIVVPEASDNGYDWSIGDIPTINEIGTVESTHASLPGVTIVEAIPELSDTNYTDSYEAGDSEVIYTLDDQTYGVQTVTVDVPEASDNGYDWSIGDIPTINETGTVESTHASLPGVTIVEAIPELSDTNYTDSYESGDSEVIYTLDDQTYGVQTVTVDVPEASDNGYDWNMTSNPSSESMGIVESTHASLPGVTVIEAIPALSEDKYSYSYNAGDEDVVYTLIDNPYDIETVTIAVPQTTDEGYNWNLTSNPTSTSTGTVEATHASLPGVTVIETIPELSEDNYDIAISKPSIDSTGEAVFTNDNYPGVEIIEELPILNDANYTMTLGEDDLVATLNDAELDFISITYDLAEVSDETYNAATVTADGEIAVVKSDDTLDVDQATWYDATDGVEVTGLEPNETYDVYTKVDEDGDTYIYPSGTIETTKIPISYYLEQFDNSNTNHNEGLVDDIQAIRNQLESDLEADTNDENRQALTDDAIVKLTLLLEKDNKKQDITDVYNELQLNSDYGDNKDELDEIYAQSLIALDDTTDIATLEQTYQNQEAALRAVLVDSISYITEDSSYSSDYDFETDGYYSGISSEEGLQSDIALIVTKLEDEEEESSFIDRLNRSALNVADEPEVKFAINAKLLKNGTIYETSDKRYTVSILLPDNVDVSGLPLVLSDENGVREIDYTLDGQILTFETDSFGDMYFVGEQEVIENLWPYIIGIGIFIVLELLIMTRKRNINKTRKENGES